MKHLHVCLTVLTTLFLLRPDLQLSGADLVRINEFMALNTRGLDDEDEDESDWIELHNHGSTAVNLDGWFLTDKADNLTKWRFPATNLPPNGFLVVFASEKDRQVGELHTNFRLSGAGEYLALVQPDGVTVVSEFAPAYPVQAPDVAYGWGRSTTQLTLLPMGAPARAYVPPDASLEPPAGSLPGTLRPWTTSVDDSAWLAGNTAVGYEADSGYDGYIGLNVTGMQNVNQTAYIRIPFTVTDPSQVESLTLWMQYDDGFIAYLNGQQIAADNAPSPADWNSGAPANRPDGTAVVPAEFNVTSGLDYLQVGLNILAIQGLNNGVGSSDFLIGPELVATTKDTGGTGLRYFVEPTPGEPNNFGLEVLGPIITEATHAPAQPTTADPILVTARISPAFGPVASARLRYRVMFNAEVEVPFLDDGLNGDGLAGDALYGATIPAGISAPGQMVRWYLTAQDGNGNPSRLPYFVDTANSPEYFGTAIQDPSLTNPLPVLHWFVQNPGAADTDAGTRCSLYFLGEFYDNLHIDIHGQSSRGFPKKSYDIDFHPGYNFRWQPGQMRVDDINLLTTYPDKAHMRNALAYEVYREAGSADHFVVPVRVERNGAFYGDYHIVENGDDNFLERNGLDPRGAFYKMYNTFTGSGDATSGAEKKTRKEENNNDLLALFNGVVGQSGIAKTNYIYDNIDIPQMINYLAARIITNDRDCCHKNYYFYRDTEGNGEWQGIAWDVDLSFGRNWIASLNYWDQVLGNNGLYVGNNNGMFRELMGPGSIFNQMYLRRVRTLMDELLQPPGTPAAEGKLERRALELLDQIGPDAERDAVAWPYSDTWGSGSGTSTCCRQSITEAVNEMINSWLPSRRLQMYNAMPELPGAQPPDPALVISEVEYNPASGNQAEEYLQITNINNYAVDISGWQLTGGIEHTFKPGTVLLRFGRLYVARDVRAFRARTVSPRGNQGLFVQGNYRGQLSARGETLKLLDPSGREVHVLTYPGTPSLPQQFLRITEIMYHPAPLAGNTNDAQAFEYVKLKNIGNLAVHLAGVRLTDAITFDFTGSAVTTLAPGETVLVVRNLAAFAARYGAGLNVAGQYAGTLDNDGERLRLLDAANEEILDFDYNNSWYPLTDGLGFSLVVVDEQAEPDLWTRKEQWRWSGTVHGAPGESEHAFPVIAPIVVNELLTHTDPPALDAVELHNPTATNVDVGGWFLTDDFGTPKKYRLADGTLITAGGYLVFDEVAFNPTPGVPPSFSFRSTGDEVYLFSGNAETNLTGYVHGFEFGPAANGVSFGRHLTSEAEEHFVAQADLTLGQANAAPRVDAIVISEIMYHPPDELVEGMLTPNQRDEYIELHNRSGAAVPLYDPGHPANTWRLQEAVRYSFPTNTILPAGGFLLVVGFDPADALALAEWRARNQATDTVPVFGPWEGQLNNAGESVELARPDAPDAGVEAPFILVERVAYSDQVPWPAAADGIGPSMHRITISAYGDEPTNWVAAVPTPGSAFAGGDIPVITAEPEDVSVREDEPAEFRVEVGGTGPFTYLWRSNGVVLPEVSGPALFFPAAAASHAATYSVVVLSTAGAVVSRDATLTVLRLPQILAQPQDVTVSSGENITLGVAAAGTGTVAYQWFRYGQPIPGATGNTLNITAAQFDVHDGYYMVTVTDDVGSRTSEPVLVVVKTRPTVTQNLQLAPSTTVDEGRTLTFTISASGSFPMGFRFRAPGNAYFAIITLYSNHNTATLVVENAKAGLHQGTWDVGVTNIAGSALSTRLTVTVQPAGPFFHLHPGNVTAAAGSPVTLQSEARGTDPISYQWYFDGATLLPDGTNASLTFESLSGANAGDYHVVAANSLGSATSTVAQLTLASGPQIVTQPADQTVTPCEPAVFGVTATGTAPLGYQWFFNTTNLLADATADTFTLAAPTPADAGDYHVVVTDAGGTATSSAATLALVLGDCDNDGMPDAWELAHGLNPADPGDRDLDADGDRRTNWEEAQSGTDPNDQASVLQVRLTANGTGGVLVEFTAMPNVSYTIEHTDLLGSGTWQTLTNIPPLVGTNTLQITDPAPPGSASRFYRLVTP